jgi:RimJ/RimL family protein N-acetyltransferase
VIVTDPPQAPGLLLRPWTEDDVPAMVAAYRDPAMRQWLRRAVTTAGDARRIIDARRADAVAGTGFSFAVVLAEPGEEAGQLAGSVSLRGLGPGTVTGEVGYWVTASARGRGIAVRAVDAVSRWAFGLPRERPLERLELLHSVGNLASCRVADKAGFAFSALLPPLPPDFPDEGHLHIRELR